MPHLMFASISYSLVKKVNDGVLNEFDIATAMPDLEKR